MVLPTEHLTLNFTLGEFTLSQSATRYGIDNTPPPEIVDRLENVLAPGMENVRRILYGWPILISSGYRCPALNQIVKGAPTSAHVQGYAADFTCPRFGTPFAIASHLAQVAKSFPDTFKFDQIIHEFGAWVHISFDPRLRGETLTIRPGSSTYEAGILPIP